MCNSLILVICKEFVDIILCIAALCDTVSAVCYLRVVFESRGVQESVYEDRNKVVSAL